MDDYRQYLAQQVLTEDKLVTYRVLSRALKIHVNIAKEMLFEFHKWQNDKRPGSLHATYLIYGINKPTHDEDGDVDMTSSQTSEDYPSVRYSDEVHTETLALAREEQLEETLAQFDEVRAIHMYSIGPHPLKDVQLLADAARQVLDQAPSNDFAAAAKTYGTISNPNMRRRERRGAGPTNAVGSNAGVKAEAKPALTSKQESKPVTGAKNSNVKEEAPEVKPAVSKVSAPTVAKKSSTAAAPSLKRQGSSSGIGQMFAKAAAKPKKPAAPKEAEKAQPSPAMSDDGQDDDDVQDQPMEVTNTEDSAMTRRSRSDRQAALRRMMDESDEEQESSRANTPPEDDQMDGYETAAQEDVAVAAVPEPKADEPAEEVTGTTNGRKRGRRRVTKKKQVMDDQGYLVTIQEEGWESFSEDEAPPATKAKTSAAAATKASSAAATKTDGGAKPKKAAGKAGQGNIMSFFSKK
ncbi:DNA polymerase subunit Cdc27 [Microdochium trichocladiopsis]|uniref:DNA polymerase delta subunit 3 n=1 Tax=Microdochium trichocladiopsis TaxID=1682393 RepID=A0A9P8Y9Z9_9PEZI|nr:DNA polymerase subunit Cdc27 [Microdochium trichocladiopsis]KAH7035794.1 DNA polymerase subunit Cdc27 [Microdochium trichocladiopsis]